MRKLTNEEFIRRAREVHGDKYDYSKVDYKRWDIKVCIICPIHGEFWQSPNKHLIGHGCPTCGIIKCTNSIRSSTDEFIKKAKRIHGDRYGYSKVDYKGNKNKVCIDCPIHGEFWMSPTHHLRGCGCPYCAGKYMNTNRFIEKAKEIHIDFFDYSKAEYKNNHTKVCVICPEHGEFYVTPNNFLNGRGCPKCKIKKTA